MERGKGLIALGGYHSFGPGGYRNTPLRDVLPIEMDRLARQDFGRPDVQRWHVPGPTADAPDPAPSGHPAGLARRQRASVARTATA